MKNGKKFTPLIWINGVTAILVQLYVFLLPWQTVWIYRTVTSGNYKLEYLSFGLYATEILLAVSALFAIGARFMGMRGTKTKFFWSADKILTLALFSGCAYVYASSLWAHDVSASMYIGRLCADAAVFFVLLIYGIVRLDRLALCFVGGAFVAALLGIGQFATQTVIASKWLGIATQSASGTSSVVDAGIHLGRWLRAYGPFVHPNIFGGYLSAAVFVLIIGDLRGWFKRKYSIGALPVLATALVFSFSRSAWLGIFLASILFLVEIVKTKKSFVALAIFWVAFTAVFFSVAPLSLVRVNGGTVGESGSVSERQTALRESREIIQENLWRGVGAHNYIGALIEKWPGRQPWNYIPVHNSIMLMFAELGVWGFAFLAFVVAAYSHLYSLIRSTLDRTVLWGGVFLLIPPLFLDYYLTSTYAGLSIVAVVMAVLMLDRVSTVNLPASTVHPQPEKTA